MKLTRIALIILMLCGTIVLSTGCGGREQETAQEQEIATIQRGNLTLDISAVGNLVLSQKENLAFELEGTIEEVLVEEGDFVEEGDVLAELDASERSDYLKNLERQVETKERELLQTEINVDKAEATLDEVSSPEYAALAIARAELEVAEAKRALDYAQAAYDVAKAWYDYNWGVPDFIMDYEQKKAQLAIAESNLADAEDTLASLPDDIEQERETRQKELTIARSKMEDAQLALDYAVEAWEEAGLQSWEIVAPFDGFITRVNISDGSEVKQGTKVIEIADPNEFEADVYVSEMDIFNVSVGIEATVQVDAIQTIILPAEVIRIAPTATIQAGVVNYEVKVKIQSLETIVDEEQRTTRRGFGNIDSGDISEMLEAAVESGRITEEQAKEIEEQSKEMAERIESSDFPAPPEGFEGGLPFAEGETPAVPEEFEGQMPFGGRFQGPSATLTSDEFQLREGLTVTVNIITEERTDVLLVPNAAVNTSGGQTYVIVVLADGTTEEREIQVGISDWQYTEVIGGLSEGDQVIVPQGSTSTTTQTGPQSGFGMKIGR